MPLFGRQKSPEAPAAQIQVGQETPQNIYFSNGSITTKPASSGTGDTSSSSESVSHASYHLASLFDVGIFRDTLAPSLALHTGLAVAAWGVGRATNRVEAKDWLWPSGLVLNAWWSSVGKRVAIDGVPVRRAFDLLSWPERVLLSGVTVWGARLFYRIASRSIERGHDDPRYAAENKSAEGYWTNALLTKFLPEAAFQAVIALPFTAPFRHQGGVLGGYNPYLQMLSVGVFTAGFALETLADYQLDAHQKDKFEGGLLREGVWSIVRHPNYLGDALMHFSLPLLLYSSDMLAPIELLGCLANYVFLRYVGGVKENEASQEARYRHSDPVKKAHLEQHRATKNAFWPGVDELKNRWLWIVVGCGAAGVAVEQALLTFHF